MVAPQNYTYHKLQATSCFFKESFPLRFRTDCNPLGLSDVTKLSISVNSSEISSLVTFQQIKNSNSYKYLVVLPALNLSIFWLWLHWND